MQYQTKTHTNQILSNQGAKEMNSTQKRRRKNKGFTLLEVLLVMAILIILMSLVGAGYFTYFANSQEDAARLQTTSIKQAVNGYYMKTGQRPQSIQDLVTPPSGMSQQKWAGPYLEGGQVPLDPWGNAYTLQINDNGNVRQMQIVIMSNGANGVQGDQDDLTTMPQQQNQQ